MPGRNRRKPLDHPGHAHELTFTCYRRYPFLTRDRTRQWLAEAIGQAAGELGFAVWAYVLMPEHVHLLIKPEGGAYSVSAILRAIKEPVGRKAVAYLKKHDPGWLEKVTRQRGQRTERLFWQSGGGYDRNIDNPETLWAVIDYIHANPVRRGLVAKPEDWVWSSAAGHQSRVHGLVPVSAVRW